MFFQGLAVPPSIVLTSHPPRSSLLITTKLHILRKKQRGRFPHLSLCRFVMSDKDFQSAASCPICFTANRSRAKEKRKKENQTKTRLHRGGLRCNVLLLRHAVRWLSLRCDRTHAGDLARLRQPGVHFTNNRAATSSAPSSLITSAARQGRSQPSSSPPHPPKPPFPV